MAVDNIARALAAKALEGSIGSVTPEDLEKKYDKTGGTISGDVSIQGNLTVSGTTTTEKEKQLLVEENVIATNANKVDLKTLLSGLAINKNASATYGIMYDPADDSVKLGLGTLDAEKKFTFNDSGTDGKAIATRADSSELTDGDLVKWDGTTNSLVDSGKKTDDFVEKVTNTTTSTKAYIAKTDGSQGTIDVATGVAANTLAQRGAGGTLKVGTAVEDSDAMPKKQVDDGFVPIHNTGKSYTVYGTMQSGGQIVQTSLEFDQAPRTGTIVQRGSGGVVQVGTPVGVNDATPKAYVDNLNTITITAGA